MIGQTSGETRRENASSCLNRHRPCAQLLMGQAIQYSRGVSDSTEKPQRTGYPAWRGV
jgi:hypothetical protein